MVIFTSIVTIIISVAGITIGIIEETKNKDQFWKNTKWQSYVYGPLFLILLGIAMLIIGLFGAIGAAKKNKCCIFIYNIGTIPLSAAFIILGIVVASVFINQRNSLGQFFDADKCKEAYKSGEKFKWISDAQALY